MCWHTQTALRRSEETFLDAHFESEVVLVPMELIMAISGHNSAVKVTKYYLKVLVAPSSYARLFFNIFLF